MTSSRPYLLRAFYEWIVDNQFTPYIVVNAEYPGVEVPQDYVENGRIILNVSPQAVRALKLVNDHVEFNARFAGIPCDVYAPVRAVTAIYAKENGRGMVFKNDDEDEDPPPRESGKSTSGQGKRGNGRPKLTIVK